MKTNLFLISALLFSAISMNVMAVDPVTDTYSYPARNDGNYTLSGKWLYSVGTGTYKSAPDNFSLNTADGTVRSMAYWNGKLIFGSRNDGIPAIIVVDAATGAVESTITLQAEGFADVLNPCNYIFVDAGNNVLVGNVKSQGDGGVFQIWKIDMATGVGTKLIDAGAQSTLGGSRIDAFSVLGDISDNATIWAVASSSQDPETKNMFKWTVTKGVIAVPNLILIDYSAGGFPSTITTIGTSPCVYPVSDELVYIDGSNTFPTLMQITGDPNEEGYTAVAVDAFYNIADATLPIPNLVDEITVEGKSFGMQISHNGFASFSIGTEKFMVFPVRAHGAYNDYPDTPQQSFRLLKFKDENQKLSEAEILWTFPSNGLSGVSGATAGVHHGNTHYIAPVAVKVNGNVASIAVYSDGNGFGVYEFTALGGSGIKQQLVEQLGIYASGKSVRFTENVASAQVYNIAGQRVAKKAATSSVSLETPGIYVVKATAFNGETIVKKVVVK